ncbi:MAG: HAMP domain-containing sensor histidine kinase [Bacilli bacterium]
MKLKKSNIFIIFLITTFLFLIGGFLLTTNMFLEYKNKTNIVIENIFTTIEKKYPEVSSEELIKIINESDINTKSEILKKYGIKENDIFINSLNKTYKNNIIFISIFLLLIISVLWLLFLIYFKNNNKSINKITKYIKEINKKNYSLDIIDNNEGELSLLKDEIYKTTIMLKEESVNLSKDKTLLKTNLEDISHQLKTPLTVITIMLDNIIEDTLMDESTRRHFIEEIRKQIDNINFLVITILKLSKFDASTITFKNEDIEVKKLINEASNNLDILKEINNVKINIMNNNAHFYGDYKWQLEAITNILKNCIEHSNNNEIDVFFEETLLYTKIVITDNGTGISEKDLFHIFDRFYKGVNSSESSFGIGLSLAKTIIDANNGFISVSSKLNVGTKFEIKYMK